MGLLAFQALVIAIVSLARRKPKDNKKWWEFAGGAVLTIAYAEAVHGYKSKYPLNPPRS